MNEGMLLNRILDIGEQMLISGAEISRVEDTVTRLCRAYDMTDIHVFTITSSMVVTVTAADGEIISPVSYTNLDVYKRQS